MSAIGIIGGMGPQASARLYELIIEGTKAYSAAAFDDDYPNIVLLNVPVPNFVSDTKNFEKAKSMLLDATKKLEYSGSTINGIACNTAHILLPDLQAYTRVPFLSIPKLVTERIVQNKYTRIGLLATPTTIESSLYDDVLNGAGKIIRPGKETIERVEKLIYLQLNSSVTKSDRSEFRQIVQRFISQNQLDCVILGCTELPLVYGSLDDERVIDTLRVLADGLLQKYFLKEET